MFLPIAQQAGWQLGLFLLQAPTGSNSGVKGLSLYEMIGRTGWAARSVAIVLIIMSIYSMSVMIERWLTFNAARNHSRQFAPKVARALRDRQIEDALTISEQHKRSHLAIVVHAGLQEYLTQQAEAETQATLAEAVRDAVWRAKALKTGELQRGLSGLATVGSTAPFVGLLGTVIGIINAFQGMTVNQGTGIEAVAGGISEALIETGFGLIVAIPSVWTFNYFMNRLEGFRTEMDNSSSELMVYLKRQARAGG
jgi:biopolymer transport protein ExbB/biopolymer transport protein TolQ